MEKDAVMTCTCICLDLTAGLDSICYPLGMSPESDFTDTSWWSVAAIYPILMVQQIEAELEQQQQKKHFATTGGCRTLGS